MKFAKQLPLVIIDVAGVRYCTAVSFTFYIYYRCLLPLTVVSLASTDGGEVYSIKFISYLRHNCLVNCILSAPMDFAFRC